MEGTVTISTTEYNKLRDDLAEKTKLLVENRIEVCIGNSYSAEVKIYYGRDELIADFVKARNRLENHVFEQDQEITTLKKQIEVLKRNQKRSIWQIFSKIFGRASALTTRNGGRNGLSSGT